jgi:hypothetical protein
LKASITALCNASGVSFPSAPVDPVALGDADLFRLLLWVLLEELPRLLGAVLGVVTGDSADVPGGIAPAFALSPPLVRMIAVMPPPRSAAAAITAAMITPGLRCGG